MLEFARAPRLTVKFLAQLLQQLRQTRVGSRNHAAMCVIHDVDRTDRDTVDLSRTTLLTSNTPPRERPRMEEKGRGRLGPTLDQARRMASLAGFAVLPVTAWTRRFGVRRSDVKGGQWAGLNEVASGGFGAGRRRLMFWREKRGGSATDSPQRHNQAPRTESRPSTGR